MRRADGAAPAHRKQLPRLPWRTESVRPSLKVEDQLELESIQRHKQEVLVEIQQLWEELCEARSKVEGLEASGGSKTLQMNQNMGMGCKKFNTDP